MKVHELRSLLDKYDDEMIVTIFDREGYLQEPYDEVCNVIPHAVMPDVYEIARPKDKDIAIQVLSLR